jgi:hypothetical protein
MATLLEVFNHADTLGACQRAVIPTWDGSPETSGRFGKNGPALDRTQSVQHALPLQPQAGSICLEEMQFARIDL